jgi:ketol-acid reductoisomerase
MAGVLQVVAGSGLIPRTPTHHVDPLLAPHTAQGINQAYATNPGATTSALAQALSIANAQGNAQAAAAATSFAFSLGGEVHSHSSATA